jgi:hypothetical protein
VGLRFELKVAFPGVLAVVVSERALDVDGVGVVPFDEVAVVAAHRTHEIAERRAHTVGQRAPEPGTLLRQIEGEIGQRSAPRRALADQHRFHQRDGFVAIGGRLLVRFHVRFLVVESCS